MSCERGEYTLSESIKGLFVGGSAVKGEIAKNADFSVNFETFSRKSRMRLHGSYSVRLTRNTKRKRRVSSIRIVHPLIPGLFPGGVKISPLRYGAELSPTSSAFHRTRTHRASDEAQKHTERSATLGALRRYRSPPIVGGPMPELFAKHRFLPTRPRPTAETSAHRERLILAASASIEARSQGQRVTAL